MYRSIVKRQMKRVVFNHLLVAVLAVFTVLTSCSGNSSSRTSTKSTSDTLTMKGTTYVNNDAMNKPNVISIETVGVFGFVDSDTVAILFPYFIDTKELGTTLFGTSIQMSGVYKRIGSTITIHFKLNEKEENPEVFVLQVKDDGKTLQGEHGERFNKVDK